MNILVVGCGKIGTAIVESLVAEGHDVTVIDRDNAVLTEITNVYDVMGVCGNGTDCDVLNEAGAARADLLVAVTDSDEANMLICFLAEQMGAAHIIARVRHPEYSESSLNFMKQHLGLAMIINPDQLAAQEVFNILKLPSAAKIETFSRRNFEMVELRLREESPLDGMSLIEMREKYRAAFLIGVVQRGDQVYIPDGRFVLKSGDRIGLTADPAEIQKLFRSLGLLQKQARRVMILGGSRTAMYLAKMLTGIGASVKLIEKNRELCQELCEALPQAVIIEGDGAQQELLREEGLSDHDAFVSLTGEDEENILMAIFAASQDVPKVVAKVNRDELGMLAERLGLECVISPKRLTADLLVQYARALQNSVGSSVETMYNLMDGQAEALEFRVTPEFRLTGVPLRELSLQPNILVAGIIRDRRTIIPSGEDVILPGDRVVVLAAGQRLRNLADIVK